MGTENLIAGHAQDWPSALVRIRSVPPEAKS
jgi:hypothetical protein